MSWKTSETPLNLIHILPSEREKSKDQFSSDNSQQLRIQVGDELPSIGTEYFTKIVRLIRGIIQWFGEIFSAGFKLCVRGCRGIVGCLTFLTTGLVVVVKKTAWWSTHLVIQSAKGVQRLSCKLWSTVVKKRSNSRLHIIPPALEQQSIQHSTKLERDELLWEVHALRDQLTAQRTELTRVTTQIGELKALALSQQQVLLHLGQEIESIESKTVRPEKASSPKNKTRSSKTAKSKSAPSSSRPSPEASMSLDPRR